MTRKDFEFSDHVSLQEHVQLSALICLRKNQSMSLSMIDEVIREYESDLRDTVKAVEEKKRKCEIEIALIERGRRNNKFDVENDKFIAAQIEAIQSTTFEQDRQHIFEHRKIVFDIEMMYKIRKTFLDLFPEAKIMKSLPQVELVKRRNRPNSLRLSASRILQRATSANLALSPRRLLSENAR